MLFRDKLKNIRLMAILIAVTLISFSCSTKKAQKDEVNSKLQYQNYKKALVTKNELDGCTWIIILDEGKRLEPMNLADEFKSDSLKIWIQYKPFHGNSICMMGEMVTITAIENRK